MWFNRLLKLLLKTKPNVSHWWRENGEPNSYVIRVTVTQPNGAKKTNWVASVLLNGEMNRKAQAEVMARLCWALDLEGGQ